MKRFTVTFFSLILVLSLAACGNLDTVQTSENSSVEEIAVKQEEISSVLSEEAPDEFKSLQENFEQDVPETINDTTTLVVYFSMPETTDPNNMTQEEDNSVVVIDGEVLGNTQYVAYVIQENTGADIFRIEPEIPYTTNHQDLVNLASDEKEQSARPAIKDHVDNMDKYNTIFIGYPNWWGDMPMILYTFFDEYDLSGKTVIPFNTHGGSRFSNTISTIANLEPGAEVNNNGFTVSRDNVEEAESDIVSWLEELGYTAEKNSDENFQEHDKKEISIEIGGTTLYAELYDTDLANEFAELLPQTITMQRVGGGREFYGSLTGSLNYDEINSQTTFENGEIAYWYSGNGLCLLYNNQVDEPEVQSGIIILGKITSDYSVLFNLDGRIEVTVALV